MAAQVTKERLDKYYGLTEEAYTQAVNTPENLHLDGAREDFLDMIKRYIDDAHHFEEQGDIVTAFAALNYAHGWLDAGARLGLWNVKDNRLFTVDDE